MGKFVLIFIWVLALLGCIYTHWKPIVVFLLGWTTSLLYTGSYATKNYHLVPKEKSNEALLIQKQAIIEALKISDQVIRNAGIRK